MQTRGTLWPEITNADAKEIVKTLFNTPGAHTDNGDYEHYQEELTPGLRTYQKWLRNKINHSNLAQRLAAGLDWLPDFAKELPSPLGFLFKSVQLARKAIVWAIFSGIILAGGFTASLVFSFSDVLWLAVILPYSGAVFYGLISLMTKGFLYGGLLFYVLIPCISSQAGTFYSRTLRIMDFQCHCLLFPSFYLVLFKHTFVRSLSSASTLKPLGIG